LLQLELRYQQEEAVVAKSVITAKASKTVRKGGAILPTMVVAAVLSCDAEQT